MSRKRTLYLSELLQRCIMKNAYVNIKVQKANDIIYFDTVQNAVDSMQKREYWNKEVLKWYVIKAIEYIIVITI